MNEDIKKQAIVEALEYYIYRLKKDDANQAAIDLYMEVLKETDPEEKYSVL